MEDIYEQKIPQSLHKIHVPDKHVRDLPPFVIERETSIIDRTKGINQEIYDNFDTNFELYVSKLSQSLCKEKAYYLIQNKRILLSKTLDAGKNGVIGTIIIRNNSLYSVLLDVFDLGISVRTGDTNNIDECVYATYFQYIRAVVIINFNVIKQDTELINNMIYLIQLILLRIIDKSVNLMDKQKDILEIVIRYFINRFYFGHKHPESISYAFENNKNYILELKSTVDLFKKYSKFADILKALIDVKLIRRRLSVVILNCINMFGITGYYCLTTSIDYILAGLICAKYPTRFLTKFNTDMKTHILLEKSLAKYYKTTKIKMDVI
jgi:hypothetical protein